MNSPGPSPSQSPLGASRPLKRLKSSSLVDLAGVNNLEARGTNRFVMYHILKVDLLIMPDKCAQNIEAAILSALDSDQPR